MISPTLDKKEYLETMREETESELSYADSLPRILDGSDEFKNQLVRSQWSYAKAQLKQYENPRTLVGTGDLQLLRNNYKRAISDYQKALILDQDYIPAYEQIVLAYSLHNRHPEAHSYFRRLLELTNNRSDIFRKYAAFRVDLLFRHGGDVPETLQVIERALETDQNDVELINTYGFILLNSNKDIKAAEARFDSALKINAKYIHSLNNKGVCLLREGRLKEAESIFESAILVAPKDYPFSHQNLALLYVKQNNYWKAYEALLKAVAKGITLQNQWDHLMGWLLVQTDQFEEAVSWYKKKLEDEPNNQLLFNNLGFCYGKLGAREKAEENFRAAVELSERQIQREHQIDARAIKAYYNLARSVLTSNDIKEAKHLTNRILDISPQDVFALYLRGVVKNREEDYVEAKRLFADVLSQNELIPEVYPDYAFILESIDKNYAEAIRILERAIQLGFDTVLINNNLAFSYIKKGDFQKAEEIISKFSKYDELPPILYATNGLLEIRKGNLDKGNELYDKAIELLEAKDRKIAKQIKLVENARFIASNGDKEGARTLLIEAKVLAESYVTKEANELLAEMT